jgi:hypothetical protein
MRRWFARGLLVAAAVGSIGNSPDPGSFDLEEVGIAAEETLAVSGTATLARTYTFIATLQSEEPPSSHGDFEVLVDLQAYASEAGGVDAPRMTALVVRSDGAVLLDRSFDGVLSASARMAEADTCMPGCAITFDLLLTSAEGPVEVDVVLSPAGEVAADAEMRAIVRIEPDQGG